MSVTTSERAEARRLQVGLGDLALWVVGAAVFFAMARGARGFWMDWVATVPKRPMLDVDRVVGVALLAPATLIGLRLLLDVFRPKDRGGRTFAVAWRLAGAAFLVGMAVLISGLSRDDRSPVGMLAADRPQWQIKLAALGLAIGTIGLLLGLVPARPARAPRPRPRWIALSVVLAGLAGVCLLAFWGDSIILYLVILALEAVANAMQRPGLMAGDYRLGAPASPLLLDRSLWPSLNHRLATAGVAAALAMLACFFTAHWLARDLRASDTDPPRSWRGLIYRVATAAASWGMGAYLLLVALPRLHPPLLEGLRSILSPTWTLAIVATFACLAAGLSARGVAGPVEVDPSDSPIVRTPWPPRSRRLVVGLAKAVLAIGLTLAILAAVARLKGGDDVLPWWSPFSVSFVVGALTRPFEWTTSRAIYLDPGLTPDALALLGMVALLCVLFARFLLVSGEAPIDRIGRDPRLIGRFLGAWLAMTGVMLTLMPAFFLGGMAVLHFTMKAYYP
jgi:hypothetical protein